MRTEQRESINVFLSLLINLMSASISLLSAAIKEAISERSIVDSLIETVDESTDSKLADYHSPNQIPFTSIAHRRCTHVSRYTVF